MTGFLFRELFEKDREEIKAEARKIMDSFEKELVKVKNLPEEAWIERGFGYRMEGKKSYCDKSFREKILINAPKKSKDSIIAEKKSWK
jgi:hypothetical protein